MKSILLKPSENMTQCVIKAIEEIKNGGTLIFQKGEYHFYEEGAFVGTFAPTNNQTGEKKVVFPLIGCKNVTVDGCGSTFVFHGRCFPFIVQSSENITIKNAVFTTAFPPYALMTVLEKHDDRFVCFIDKNKTPYLVNNGHLVFPMEGSELSTADQKLSMHRLGKELLITYLFAGDSKASKENLPAHFTDSYASEDGEKLVFTYRHNEKSHPCAYNVGETISVNLEENRSRDIIFLEDSENTVISGITLRRGGGMGVIAQLCTNIEIEALTVKPTDGELITITADIIHLVNCSGKVSIHDCDLASSLDDACNIHGTYSVVMNVGDGYIDVKYGHEAQDFLDMYREGDVLTVINNKTLDIIGKFTVSSSEFSDSTGLSQRIYSKDIPCGIDTNFFIESAERMPDIHIYNNKNFDIPHWRLSGAGSILVENNIYEQCDCPVYAYDLAEYWYESGRIKDITVRSNTFIGTRNHSGSIMTGVSGFESGKAPVIHGNLTIENNIFTDIIGKPYTVEGFKCVNIANNIFDGKKE